MVGLQKSQKNGYSLNQKLGEGGYGLVYKGTRNKSQVGEKESLNKAEPKEEIVYAIKVMKLAPYNGLTQSIIREVSLNKKLGKHVNIVEMCDTYREDGSFNLVFELLKMDLGQFIERNRKRDIPSELIKSFIFDLVSALDYCHSKKIIHRDVKPQNLLLGKDGRLKLGDFGLAREMLPQTKNFKYTDQVITQWYRPPELLLGKTYYGKEIDMWSVGCVMGELLLRRPLFPAFGTTDIDQMRMIISSIGSPHITWPAVTELPRWNTQEFEFHPLTDIADLIPQIKSDKNAISFLNACICYNPKKRITAPQALAHPYLLNFKN